MSRFSFSEGDLIAGRFGTDYAASDRFARVELASQHGESLTFVGADGREILGDLVSFRSMTDSERDAFENYGRPLCAGCGESHDVVVGVQAGEEYCAGCAVALCVFATEAA